MILTQKLVPKIYTNLSRDFQYLSKIFDIVFNYVKTNADIIKNNYNYNYLNSNLIDLILSTVGFNLNNTYDNEQLLKLVSIFIDICRNKGSEYSIKQAIALISKIDNNGKVNFTISLNNNNLNIKNVIFIYTNIKLSSLSLLEHIFKYIIPIGVSYVIYLNNSTNVQIVNEYQTSTKLKINIESPKISSSIADNTNKDNINKKGTNISMEVVPNDLNDIDKNIFDSES